MTSYSNPDRSEVICTSLMWHVYVYVIDSNRIEMDVKHIEMNCEDGKLQNHTTSVTNKRSRDKLFTSGE